MDSEPQKQGSPRAAASMVPSMRSSFSSLHKRKRSRMSLSHAPSSISRGRGPLASPSLTCSLNPVQNSLRRSVMLSYKSSPLKGQTKLSTHTPEMTPFTLMRKIVRTGPIKSPAVFQKSPILSIEQQEPRIPSSTKASRRSHRKSLTKLNIQHKVIVDKALKLRKRWKHQSRVDPQAFVKDGNNSVSLQLTTLEGSAEDSVQGRNMHRNACCETRRMNHQFFFKRLQEMESNNLTQVENDYNDCLGNDNYERLVPNQGQKEENVLEDLNGQMHCTPMLQIGTRSNDRTVTECDKNVSQDEPTTRAEPENTSSQPSSNRSSKAAANSGHSFESPAAAEGGIEEEVGWQGSMEENEIFNEAEAIEKVIAEKLGMKFMLQEEEAFLNTINEDNDLDRNQGEGKTLSLLLNTLEMSAEERVRRRNMRRNARRETRRVISQLFLKQLQEMDSSNLMKEKNDYNGCLDNGNYNMLLPNQGQKEDNVLEGLNEQMHCTPMLQTGTRGNDNTVIEYDESDIQGEPACPADPEGTSSNQSKAAMDSGHSFESPATAEVGIEEVGDWQGSMGEHEILHEAEVIGRVVAEKLGMKSVLQGEEASLGTSPEDQNLDRHQGEGKTLSLLLNTLERSAEERVRGRNMRKNARHDARRVTHQAFLKRLQEMDSSNPANEEHDYIGCLDDDNYDMLVPNQGKKEDIVLEDLNGQMHCTPILQAETRRNDKTMTEFHKSDIHGEPASQAEPGGSSSQPSSNRSKAAMNSGHSFENPATAEVGIEEEGDWQGSMEEHEILHEAEVIGRVVSEKLGMKSMLQGEEASLGTSHEDQNLDRNQGEGKTSNLLLNTLERSAQERVQGRNMRKNARHDARRVTHQAFLKRLQEMDSSNLTEEENDDNDFLDNDNFHMLVANQGQEEDNVLEDLNGQMHCTPILQTGMRRNDKTVTEYDDNYIQGEPASQAEPEGTSSQPLSNRSKAGMNSGHSFENPATAVGGSEEEEDGQGSMKENEMLHEADAIDRVITEKLGMKFMLQGEEFSLDTIAEENDLNRIDGMLPHEESTLFENLLSFVEESPDMSRAQKSGMLPLQEITLFENQLSLVKATPDMSRVRKSRKANNKSGSTRKVVKPWMREETQLSIPGKAIKNVLSRYSRCPVKPATVRAVQERFPEFLAQMCDDLEAYAVHAGRKTVKPADVELLLKRQGHITDTMPLEALVRQHLPMQERALLLPMACAYNRLEPAPKHFKNWH